MKRAVQMAVFALGVLLLIPVAHAQKTRFTATLSGSNQVPAVETSATGRATFQVSRSGKSVSYTLFVTGIEDPTMAHIHLAAAGEDGPPVVWLYPTKAHPVKSGKVSGLLSRGTITAAQLVGPLKGKTIADLLEDIRGGNTYVNVHSKAHPGGEIRGQIQ
jgi:CHRD domain